MIGLDLRWFKYSGKRLLREVSGDADDETENRRVARPAEYRRARGDRARWRTARGPDLVRIRPGRGGLPYGQNRVQVSMLEARSAPHVLRGHESRALQGGDSQRTRH